jgi:hypothetical protein
VLEVGSTDQKVLGWNILNGAIQKWNASLWFLFLVLGDWAGCLVARCVKTHNLVV